MSSRFLKKVTDIYGNNGEIDQSKDDELSDANDDVSYSSRNKFNILLSDSTENEEEVDKPILVNSEKSNNKVSSKSKAKTKKKKKVDAYKEMTEDEVLNMFGSLVTDTVPVDQKSKNEFDILDLRLRNLNENIELQQLFGPPVEPTPGTRSGQRNTNPILKFTFGKRSPNWPNVSVRKLGLQMERCSNQPNNSNRCLVTCSQEYLEAERALKKAMRTGDFQEQLRRYPYHVNTLLQVASMLARQEDFSVAADLLKRVFYVYETIAPLGLSLLGSRSGGSLTKSSFTLDYRHRNNRGIFIALFQWILYLAQKSCFNTALEYCKVLFSLNVDSDPLAVILLIDDLAIRCDQYDFLIGFYSQFESRKALKYLPNYAFSLALCHFFRSVVPNSKDGAGSDTMATADELLQAALRVFPTFVLTIENHCRVHFDGAVSRAALFAGSEDPAALRGLLELYGKRMMNVWKSPPVLDWLEGNARRVLERCDDPGSAAERARVIAMYSRETPLAIRRHMELAGHEDLVRQSARPGLSGIAFDPFPPANGEGGFDHYAESDIDLQLDESWLVNLLRSFWPSFGVVQQ